MNIHSKSMAPSGAIRGTRIEGSRLADELNEQGFAVLEKLLSREECRSIASFYPDDNHFRSRVVMDRHGFGKGEYKYPPGHYRGFARRALFPSRSDR